MKELLGIALILVIGLVVSRRWFGKVKLWGYARFFYLTGEEFLLLGLALGPLVTGVIDRETLRSLQPFVGLGLGYVGFLFGMQLRAAELVAVPKAFYAGTLGSTAVSLAVLAPPMFMALSVLTPGGSPSGALTLAVAATAVGSSTSFLYLVDRYSRAGRAPVFRFLRFSSVFDDLWGVLLFGAALCWLRQEPGFGVGLAGASAWMAVSLVVGLLSGGLLILAASTARGDEEVILFLLGVILFSGGLASFLKVSPLFTNLLAGALFANFSRHQEPYHERLRLFEKPLYLILLVLGGTLWDPRVSGLPVLAALYVILRLAGKVLGGELAGRTLGGSGTGGRIGFGLLAQSEMAVAMMVNLMLLYDDEATRLAISAVFVSVLANDLLSSLYYSRLNRSG